MPITVARIEDDPVILLVKVTGAISAEEFEDMVPQTNDLIEFATEPVFRIFDVRSIAVTVTNMLTAFKRIQSSAADDRHIHPAMLGNHQWMRLIREIFKDNKKHHLPVPMFVSMELTLEYIDDCLETLRVR